MVAGLEEKVKAIIRDVPDFPKPGIIFKDITPVLADPHLCKAITSEMAHIWRDSKVEVVAGIEARGFLFGMLLAQKLEVPFVPVRKEGKLPFKKIKDAYDLEYGSAVVEMHVDALQPGMRVLIHDDLLATGGTAGSAARLIKKLGGEVAGFSFLVELAFLKGRMKLEQGQIHSLIRY